MREIAIEDIEEIITASAQAMASEATFGRAYKIFYFNTCELTSYNASIRKATFKIESDSSDSFYNVTLELDNLFRINRWSCNCIAAQRGFCKHATASALLLGNLFIDNDISPYTNYSETHLEVNPLTIKNIEAIIPRGVKTKVKKIFKQEAAAIQSIQEGKVLIDVVDENKIYSVKLNKPQGDYYLEAECNCNHTCDSACVHQLAALFELEAKHGTYAFEESYDWSAAKEEMLKEYGLEKVKDYSQHVDFTFENGMLKMVKKTPDLFAVQNFDDFIFPDTDTTTPKTIQQPETDIGFVFINAQSWDNSEISIIPIKAKYSKKGEFGIHMVPLDDQHHREEVINLASSKEQMGYLNLPMLNKANKEVNFAVNNSLFNKLLLALSQQQTVLTDLFSNLSLSYCFFDSNAKYGRQISKRNISKINLSADRIETGISIKASNGLVNLKITYSINGKQIKLKKQPFTWSPVVVLDDSFHLWDSAHCRLPLFLTKDPAIQEIQFPVELYERIAPFIKLVQGHIPVFIDAQLTELMPSAQIEKQIVFTESGEFLIIQPMVKYGETQIPLSTGNAEQMHVFENGKTKTIERDKTAEQDFLRFVVEQHPEFSEDTLFEDYFYVSINEAIRNFWFVRFCQQCKEQNIEIFGTKALKKIKHFPGAASISYSSSSDVDWFNVGLDVSFGDETVSLKEVQKAVLKNNGLVKLSDGRTGVLPEDWLKRWSTAFELGKIRNGELHLTKSQFALINALYADLQDEDIYAEISEKLTLLETFEKLEPVKTPKQLKATLRDYQQSGLNWLAFLTQFGFGGCLADDMGLGKTVQIIALICHLKYTKKEKGVHLVVCPTTLLFNWQRELEKFAPSLKFTCQWGANRSSNIKDLEKFDVVLTSYGTLSNDIEMMSKHRFKSIILDESQAIKNPTSLRFKCVCVMKADYRFTMTGTPIENNTMELFAQMEFLNPGLLGSPTNFKKEFAFVIDKGESPERSDTLKKMVYPFILRRTKEVVAKELPEKTEMVLYCEMGEQQRKVYNAFMNDFREKILDDIDADGMNSARFTILDALLKARQICDSPALLNTEEDYGNDSIKTDELIRHIERKTRNHKILVFSQFVGMLDIIRNRLDKDGVSYAYLDGSTRNRESVVDSFVSDNSIRVFLISLKAGGFGLNLTVADYVYLIDPWWNPAVEAQAIDRVHRIGQDKKIFAYRMICKDTIEEKIIKLQEKKKGLANEIISSEQSFVKNLTREDIEDLFV